MAKAKYHAVTEFLDAKQRRIKLNQPIPDGRYDEGAIKHYLHHKMIAPGEPPKPVKPEETKPVSPEERKAKTLSALEQMDQADPDRKNKDLWTNTGLPEVKAINAALEESKAGFTVNAKERDAAWSEYEKTKEPTE